MCERSSSRICAVTDPGSEDEKIITLARSARARVAAAEGAAVRDETGRTYAAAAVNLPSLRLSALRLAVAMAISSGAAVLEAAALVSDADAPDPRDLARGRPRRGGLPRRDERHHPGHAHPLTRPPRCGRDRRRLSWRSRPAGRRLPY